MAKDKKEKVEKAISEIMQYQKWYGVKIDRNLFVQETTEAEATAWSKKPVNKVGLLEENVETMITAAFQNIFSNKKNLFLIYRYFW